MDCFGTYFIHMSKPNVTRVQSATERTASVHTLHMSKPNVTRVQSATERTASVLLRTAKCYSTTTPLLLRTTKCYSSTTPYCKVLLLCTTNQNNQPASQPGRPANTVLAGRPGHMEAAGRPAGEAAGRPAGWQGAGRPAGDEIANKSTVLSFIPKLIPNPWFIVEVPEHVNNKTPISFHSKHSNICHIFLINLEQFP